MGLRNVRGISHRISLSIHRRRHRGDFILIWNNPITLQETHEITWRNSTSLRFRLSFVFFSGFFLFSQFFWCLLIQPTVKCFGFLMILMIFNSFGFWIWFGSTQRRRWRQQQSNSNSKRKESRAAAGQREREKSPPPPPPPPTATPSSGQLNNYCNML